MMNPLLEQFLIESREFLQGIAQKLMELEDDPESKDLMTELFRMVHTLKGNSGLFDFPEMTRVLHAGEDLMDAVREAHVIYSQELADTLLDAMDFISHLLDEVESTGNINASHAAPAHLLSEQLRALIPARDDKSDRDHLAGFDAVERDGADVLTITLPPMPVIPEAIRIIAWHAATAGESLFLIGYRPEAECFFKGEDPFYQARHVPGALWGEAVYPDGNWPALVDMDMYRCQLVYHVLCAASASEVAEYFRYVPEQVRVTVVRPFDLILPQGHPNGGPVYSDFVQDALAMLTAGDYVGLAHAARTMLELSSPELWLSSALRWLIAILESAQHETMAIRLLIESLETLIPPDVSRLYSENTPTNNDLSGFAADSQIPATCMPEPRLISHEERQRILGVLEVQCEILSVSDAVEPVGGRLRAVAATVKPCLIQLGEHGDELEGKLHEALQLRSAAPMREWLVGYCQNVAGLRGDTQEVVIGKNSSATPITSVAPPAVRELPNEPKVVRPAPEHATSKVLKVDQEKVDRLMNLIGEMVVAKNALPYLANRAENQYGVRELAREIKSQYAVINRIAEDMQDAIMQVRMLPVSFVFQRFPRLVRDISRKLSKEVELVLLGEETEADKNIIESLADPLIHIVRNSLDHGLETADVRQAAGKPRVGRLVIKAHQESDRVVIEISDDGRGIDPHVIKSKAFDSGIIDEATLERITDQEAINLVFASGFSTAQTVSDLSGRGVGMDVVRNAIEKVGGAVTLSSTLGKGTTLSLSLPLSMAVTNVMIIESDRQIFGIPMDLVVETVRLTHSSIREIKRRKATVLRGNLIPLVTLNELLGVAREPRANEDGEYAAIVVRVGSDAVGLLVDNFREVVDVILKPLQGELAQLTCYAGTALLGDGSVLMVLNPRELL